MVKASHVFHPAWGRSLMARNAKEDLWDASTHSFLMTVRPRQRTEVQIPETAQPRQGVRSPSCVLFMLIRSRHAGWAALAAQEGIQMPEPGAWSVALHPNHTFPPLPLPHHRMLQARDL